MHGVRLRPESTVIELRVRLFNRSERAADLPVVGQRRRRGARRLPVVLPRRRDAGRRPRQAGDQHLPGRDRALLRDRLSRAGATWTPGPTARAGCRGTGWTGRATSRCRPRTCAWGRAATSSAATTTVPVPASCTGPTTTTPSARSSGPGATTPFGHAWNRNLADDGAAYIELMAGVFTDNQPDFSHLAPGRDQEFSQYWYPVAGTGPAVAANLDVALGVERERGPDRCCRFDATRDLGPVELVVRDRHGARTLTSTPRSSWARTGGCGGDRHRRTRSHVELQLGTADTADAGNRRGRSDTLTSRPTCSPPASRRRRPRSPPSRSCT